MCSAGEAHVKRKHVLNNDNTVTVFNLQGNDQDTYTYELLTPMPTIPNPGFDISTVQKQYAMCKAQFEKTDYYKKFVAFFESALLRNQSPPITRILCLGKGSFSLGSIKTPNSYYQLAVVEVMLELLRRKYTIDDKDVYFQDPLYTAINGAFLALYNFTVVDVPEGYNKITPTTLVPSGTKRMNDDRITIEEFKRSYLRQDMPDEIDNDHNYVGNAIYWAPHTK
ncbi:hypothetical protein MMC32_005463 [Xylographa parallela]|nr:hypothetical protein [Xylographa parallela]